MYKIYFNQAENPYELTEMARMFLPNSAFEILCHDPGLLAEGEDVILRIPDHIRDKNEGKRYLYEQLGSRTGYRPDWGILTGIRPVKLAGDLVERSGSEDGAREILRKEYLLSSRKADLLLSIRNTQKEDLVHSDQNGVGLYIGIPFCPTRCLYCSFPSYEASGDRVQKYLKALYLELEFVGREMRSRGLYPESVYMGGGTPTTLSAADLSRLMRRVNELFDTKRSKEFTVEAGRPDTITSEKLAAILENGGDRISINPQSMNDETLRRIGRNHSREDVIQAFRMARGAGFHKINADVIAGLPGEEPEDFLDSLKTLINLHPENVTVHTLAVKRASRLKEEDREYSYRQGKAVRQMLDGSADLLAKAGYRPYYLYRQKQMAGNLENVGYSLPSMESVYNIKIMEENQTIIAMGAGAISKVWFPEENRLLRVPNVSNYEIYIERIEEMILRKRKGIFI